MANRKPINLGPVRYLWAIWALALFFLSLYLAKPGAFDRLAAESGVIENFAALFFLAASVVYGSAIMRNPGSSKILKACMALACLVLFVMAMEEISWFQHFLGFQTPELFSGNMQNETNLHNFETDTMELLFYNGTFILLVVLPFIKWHSGWMQTQPLTRNLVGNELVFLTAILPTGFSDDIGRSTLTQILCSLAALFLISRIVSIRELKHQLLFIAWLLLHLGAVTAFYLHPELAPRAWVMTEYKEFFIGLAYLVNARFTYKELQK